MTRKEAGRLWPIIKAYSEGRQIEVKDPYDGKWKHAENPDFTFGVYSYRVEKEPVCRPFEGSTECCEEMIKHKPFGWIKSSKGVLSNILEIGEYYIVLAKYGVIGFDGAINDFVFVDGTPFGIKKED